MPKLIEEHPTIDMEQFLRYGISFRHLEISKFGLWWRWIVRCIFNDRQGLSWDEVKTAARNGGQFVRMQFCGSALWTNVYHLKGCFVNQYRSGS